VAVDDTTGEMTRLDLRWDPVSARLDPRITAPPMGKVGVTLDVAQYADV